MAFDTIILRREWENRSSAAVLFFWVCFQIEHESEIWLLYSAWLYTTDLSRAFCLSETFIVPPWLFVTLFLPFSCLCWFIVFHNPEPCLAIPFPYLSYCQQGFITANTERNPDVCVVESNKGLPICYYLRRAVWCSVYRGTKCQWGGPGSVAGRYFQTFELALMPCEGAQINLCFWYKNNKNLLVNLYATYLKKYLGDFQ